MEAYAATYHSKTGKAVVHVVAPPPMSEAQKATVLQEFYKHAWAAWNLMPVEQRLRINAEYESEGRGADASPVTD